MKRWMLATALVAAVVTGGQLAPVVSAAWALGDPFDDARHYVVNKQNEQAIKLIDGGEFPIDQPNYEGWTLLHYAAESGNLAMVKLLLERGADPTLKTKWGSTPYDVAGQTMIKATLEAAVKAKTGVSPAPAARAPGVSPAAKPSPMSTPAAAATPQSARDKMCQARWYASQALCSDSTCKMREYRKWATCKKTGSYY